MVRPPTPPGSSDPVPRIPPLKSKNLSATDKKITNMVNQVFVDPPEVKKIEASERLASAIGMSKILEKILPQKKSPHQDQMKIETITLNGIPRGVNAVITRDPSVECIVNKEKKTFSFPTGFVIKNKQGKLGDQFQNLFPLPISFTLESVPEGIKITFIPLLPTKAGIMMRILLKTAMAIIDNTYVISYKELPEFLKQLPEWKPETT